MEEEVAKFIGNALAYGGGGAGVAYLLFRYLGASWIENKFSMQLEQFKHEQEIEIQRLRIEIDSTLSGTIKLQEFEFGTIPEAWRLLDSAFNSVAGLVNPAQQYTDLDRMDDDEIEEFLESCELLETQKSQVRNADKKGHKFIELIFHHKLHHVKVKCLELSMYVAQNGIFFPKEMKENFEEIVEKLHSASIAKVIDHESKDFQYGIKAWKEVSDEIVPFRKAIEDAIYERLHSHGMVKK